MSVFTSLSEGFCIVKVLLYVNKRQYIFFNLMVKFSLVIKV